MIYKALPLGGAFSIYSEAGIDCQPKMRKILGEKGWRVWPGFVGIEKALFGAYSKIIHLSL